jgi:AcrR family transcriptional regulator
MAKSDTRDKLLAAALEVFSEKGFAASTTREIADRAGVREITLFRHFESKDRLFSQAVTENMTKFSPGDVLPESFNTELSGDLEGTLTMLAEQYVAFCKESAPYMRVGIMEAPSNKEFASSIAEIPQQLETRLAAYLRSLHTEGRMGAHDFEVLAKMFYGVLFSYVFSHYLMTADSEVTAEKDAAWVESSVRLFVKGLL